MAYCEQLRFDLAGQTYAGAPLRVHIDARDLRGGEKVWSWVKKGVPIRLEIGPRDIEKNAVFMARRDRPPKEKEGLERAGFIENAAGLLQEIQGNLYQRALDFRRDNTVDVSSEQELTDYFKNGSGFARCYYAEDPTVEERLGTLKITARNQPLGEAAPDGNCIFSGKPGKLTVFAKAY
jgi:prolyl-tRNA synthetase